MRVVVLGHPRSGTGYVAALFRSVGWDVGHERIGRDGISSWMWAVQADEVPWGDARGQRALPATVLHVVRDPVQAVASVAHTEQGSEAWRRRWVCIPREVSAIERAVRSLDGWQALIEAQRPSLTFALGDAEAAVARVTGREVRALRDAEARNARRHRALKRRDIERRLSEGGLDAWRRLVMRWESLPRVAGE